ncbi:MAG: capsule assembly Wzi family protein [Agarilytica sp.]
MNNRLIYALRNRTGSRIKAIHFSLLAILFWGIAPLSFATPWVEVGDERTRHHLLFLRDSGAINMPLTSWPVNWVDISREMTQMRLDELSAAQLWSYRYLRHELSRATRGVKTTKRFHGSSNATPFIHFASDTREKASAVTETTFMYERFAVNIEAQVVHNPFDGDQYSLDGSFAAATLGNWVFGIGNIERWWGPGAHSSLILSNNARPTTSIFAKRLESLGADSQYLSIFGPWTIELFASELEEAEFGVNSNLFGGRFAINPTQFLELGVNTTAIESDQERQDLNAEAQDKERMELIGYDARLGFNIQHYTFAIYGQLLEQKGSNSDVDPALVFGSEVTFLLQDIHSRLTFETSNTEASEATNSSLLVSQYDHSHVENGYRYKGRNLAESAGGNATKNTLSGEHFFTNGHQLSWRYSDIRINESGGALNMHGSSAIKQQLGELKYAFPFNEMTKIEIGTFQLSETLELQDRTIDSGSNLSITIRF